jgi:nicotinic acid mononucleotide adenylyltransferase
MAIAVGGSAAKPVHSAHVELCELLVNCGWLGRVIWKPDATRADKQYHIEAQHRVNLIQLAFPNDIINNGQCRFDIDYSDIYKDHITYAIDYLEALKRLCPSEIIFWYTGVDSVMPKAEFGGKCEIAAWWHRGEELLKKWPFIIFPREGLPHPSTIELPTGSIIFDCKLPDVASHQIWQLIREEKPWEYLYGGDENQIVQYIKRYNLCGWKG